MSIQGWEPRPLPSEERCRRWYAAGGRLLVTWKSGGVSVLEPIHGEYVSPGGFAGVRPWRNNNPALWDTFFAETHPPIPEGWEKVGEWAGSIHTGAPLVGEGPAGVFRFHTGDGFGIYVRKVPPPVDWGDVPKGVELAPVPSGGRLGGMFVIRDGVNHGTVEKEGGHYWAISVTGAAAPSPSLPAAIVALTGRRT